MFKDAYLRVLSPVTSNGVNPVMLPNGKIKYTESHLHVSAKTLMERKNAKLPAHLKHIIDVVQVDPAPEEKRQLSPDEIRAEITRLQDLQASLEPKAEIEKPKQKKMEPATP